jgi:hypothetical protein
MPSVQRGIVEKRGDRWSARWRDETGRSHRRTFGSGREGKADAAAFLAATVEAVEAVRRGQPPPAVPRSPSRRRSLATWLNTTSTR